MAEVLGVRRLCILKGRQRMVVPGVVDRVEPQSYDRPNKNHKEPHHRVGCRPEVRDQACLKMQETTSVNILSGREHRRNRYV